MTKRATPLDAAPSSAAPAEPQHLSETLDDWTALDALAFDSSLSFLDDVDTNPPVNPQSRAIPSSPLVLPESDADDVATAALLNDMLALADENAELTSKAEAPSEETTSEDASPSPSPSVVPPHKGKSKCKSALSRSRQKDEIEYLRVQVAELEHELATLKPRDDRSNGHPKVWENIAKRQSDAKQLAEIENMKLRELIEGQLRVARSLEKLLRKRVLTQDDALFVERKRPRALSSAMDLEDVAKEIDARIANQFKDVDAVIQECRLTSLTVDQEDSRATTDANNAICMELTMVKTFPFEMADVAEAVWQCTSSRRIALPNGYYGGTQRSEARADLQFAVNLRVRRSEATIHVRGVGARRTVGDRAMIVFENFGATEGALFAGQGVNCRERGYIVIENGPPSSTSASTIVRVCVRMYPEVEGDDSTVEGSQQHPNVGLFVDLVVGSYNSNAKTMLQVIENLLLARSTQGSSPLPSNA